MARQYKLEATYFGVGTTAEIYWHDNDTLEFVSLPQVAGADPLALRAELIATLINFMKKDRVTHVEVTKMP